MGELLKFSLEDHLTECEDRYQQIVDRLDTLDERMYRLEVLLLDLRDVIKKS
jgi:hypothetical protein